jgi:ABC-type glycerol-3-phosphate transport system substrate-binding protein
MDDDALTRRLAATLSEAEAAVPGAPPEFVAATRGRYARARARRARLAALASSVLVLVVTAVAGTAIGRGTGWLDSPAAVPGHDVVRVWTLHSDLRTGALRKAAERFNGGDGAKIEITEFGTDDYKSRLRAALGTSEAPDIFLNWGGGDLAELVRRREVLDLTGPLARHPGVVRAFRPEILDAARVDGGQYGLPMSGVQPVVLFYNRAVFAEASLRPPTTYDELLSLVDAFRDRGVVPLALAGAQGWSELMYLMYLVDRIGGAAASAAIAAGQPGAWADPAVLAAAESCRDLAERGAFGEVFESVWYDGGGASRLLATGRAAMHVMGSWEYMNQLTLHPEFVRDDRLGWVPFPAVPGAGDPDGLVGVPANYFSVAAASPHAQRAVDFLADALTSDGYLDGLVRAGELPAVRDAGVRAETAVDGDFVRFTERLLARAPSFTLAWDQALGPVAGERLNALVRQLFQAEITAEEFVTEMARLDLTDRGVPG